MPNRKELVEAAKDLNESIVDPSDPIKIDGSVEVITKGILEAAELLVETDEIDDNTRKVIDELQAPSAEKAKPPKVKATAAVKPTKAKKTTKSPAAKAAKKLAAAKTDRKPRALRAGAGVVSDFKPVRAGTKYEALLKMIDKKSVDAIAEHYKVSRTDILWFFRYPFRKHGIDHKVDDKGMISLVLPAGKTVADCVLPITAA